jgi:hypothetical protein
MKMMICLVLLAGFIATLDSAAQSVGNGNGNIGFGNGNGNQGNNNGNGNVGSNNGNWNAGSGQGNRNVGDNMGNASKAGCGEGMRRNHDGGCRPR